MNYGIKTKVAALELQKNSNKPYKDFLLEVEKAYNYTDHHLSVGLIKSDGKFAELKEIITKHIVQTTLVETKPVEIVELTTDNIELAQQLDVIIGDCATDMPFVDQVLAHVKQKVILLSPNSEKSQESTKELQIRAWEIIDELSREIEEESKALKEARETLDGLLTFTKLDNSATYWQSPKDGTVYKAVEPNGTFVEFKKIGYNRTRRVGEKTGTLSLTEAKEHGFDVK